MNTWEIIITVLNVFSVKKYLKVMVSIVWVFVNVTLLDVIVVEL